jgi:hypothetical protein
MRRGVRPSGLNDGQMRVRIPAREMPVDQGHVRTLDACRRAAVVVLKFSTTPIVKASPGFSTGRFFVCRQAELSLLSA